MGTWLGPRTSEFPLDTLLINVVGSLLLGFLARWFMGRVHAPVLAAGLTVGFCGGFTTFSAFSLETVTLLARGRGRSSTRSRAWHCASVGRRRGSPWPER